MHEFSRLHNPVLLRHLRRHLRRHDDGSDDQGFALPAEPDFSGSLGTSTIRMSALAPRPIINHNHGLFFLSLPRSPLGEIPSVA